MTWTLPSGWLAAMRQSGNRPVVVARLVTQPWASLNVIDFSAAEVEPLLEDRVSVAGITLLCGTDFLCVTSNTTTATNLANAFNDEAEATGTAMWARAVGTRVFFIQ